METTPVVEGISFILKISFPEKHKPEVETALWAWETFGGIGARTRRGFGAIRLVSIKESGKKSVIPLPEFNKVENSIVEFLQKTVKKSKPSKDIPHLAFNIELRIIKQDQHNPFANSLEAWKHLIDQLKLFRQKRTRPNVKDPGRSKWPEPDTIRNLTNTHTTHHAPIFDKESPFNSFPRAAFGLPIIFEFHPKDRSKHLTQKDPKTTMLVLSDSDRLASPLILRPLVCRNNRAVGLAIILEGTQTPLEKEVKLISKETKEEIAKNLKVKLDKTEINEIWDKQERSQLKGKTDVLKAFLKWLKPD